MVEAWPVGDPYSERFPIWTRANVGEVFPDPVAPLTYTLLFSDADGAVRDAFAQMGAFTPDEFDRAGTGPIRVFNGYCYLSASIFRIFGERAPGMSAEAMDEAFFGTQPGIPPYVAQEGDHDEARSADMAATFAWVLETPTLDMATASAARMDQLHRDRPDLEAMSNAELWPRARDLMLANFRQLFAEHIYVTFLSPIPFGLLGQICADVGRPGDAMKLISGIGDVESAAPSWAMWDLSRLVAADRALMAAFDAGTDGLLEQLAETGVSGQAFLDGFDRFLDRYGSRGPNEWEMRNHTWETRPALALAAIDRMRLSDAHAEPEARHQARAAERERLMDEIAALLEDDDSRDTFRAAARAAALFNAGRERTKTNCVKLIQECRMAMHLIGHRMVEQGHCDDVADFGLLRADEMDAWLGDPEQLRDALRERRDLHQQYAALQEPFVFVDTLSDPSTWPTRAEVHAASDDDAVAVGDVLPGVTGCPGRVTGVARIVLDPLHPTALGPGEILVAPITDPSWTPLFVPAAGVVVDVGAAQSHAMIVSRELGIPCVPSVTGATRRIPDGATVEVDGDAGQVIILALPTP